MYNISIVDNLNKLEKEAKAEIAKALSDGALIDIKVKWLGRKGKLTGVLRGLKDMSEKKRKIFGSNANTLKNNLEKLIEKKYADIFEEIALKYFKDHIKAYSTIDLLLPTRSRALQPGTAPHTLQRYEQWESGGTVVILQNKKSFIPDANVN